MVKRAAARPEGLVTGCVNGCRDTSSCADRTTEVILVGVSGGR